MYSCGYPSNCESCRAGFPCTIYVSLRLCKRGVAGSPSSAWSDARLLGRTAMCGRFACSLDPGDSSIVHRFRSREWIGHDSFRPSQNVGPGMRAPVVRTCGESERVLHTMKWGLVPSWTRTRQEATQNAFRMINARSETAAVKPAFRNLLAKRRCIVVADGFFEWKEHPKGKQPFFLFPKDGPLYLAALYDVWDDKDKGEQVYSFTILTVDSSNDISWLHDRMPALLCSEEERDEWLSASESTALRLLRPRNGMLDFYEVAPKMNSTKYQGSDCTTRYDEIKRKTGIGRFFAKADPFAQREESKLDMPPAQEAHASPKRQAPDGRNTSPEPSNATVRIKAESESGAKQPDARGSSSPLQMRERSPKEGSRIVQGNAPSKRQRTGTRGPLDAYFRTPPS